ncbi:MAG: response regulator transcription factor [Saprospiraceae bacterium]
MREVFPEKGTNKERLQQVAALYEKISFPADILVGLYHHSTASFCFISNNLKQLSGYTSAEVQRWGKLITFKVIHRSHYSFMYQILRQIKRFDKNIPVEYRKEIESYTCGINIICKNNIQKRVFLKTRNLSLNGNGLADLTIVFMEDVSHLLQGQHYWCRGVCREYSFAFVNQKGKKDFKDLLSKREMEILKLIAQHHASVQIAEILHLSKLTVDTHRKNMLKRTGAINSTALVELCRKTSLI